MIPYIIINGKSSRTINGLIIQSLPPISKPQIRIETEEIDGRDGDIVSVLGYSAYDKTLTVGLRGDYSVDDVIDFFDSKGKVIFSNELDKYYNFAIYEQIDFNRLLRFRTATVTMHMQPFKYSVDDKPVTWSGDDTAVYLPVRNKGNIYSKPRLEITGANDIVVNINDKQVLTMTLSAGGETIIIDDMNAISPAGDYLNRKVSGDYDELTLKTGVNDMYITGELTSVKVDKYSRWI